ncbi:MAG: LLM class flavin-dependent oxidoreductase [Arachidicoccus sp.]|nr:LLM class flavin-dependent oxidoreductase [Arachidicoccus sp.]
MGSKIEVSVLDLAFVIEGSSVQESLHRSLDLARHAEQMGYKRFWLAEHHNMESIASSATSVLIGYVAQGTQNIRVGSGGVMLPNHSSLIVAEQFGTLETLYPNRIDLGVGRAPGTDGITAMAIGRNPMTINETFPQQIKELQLYFSAENKNGKVRAMPGEGLDIPIYILGSSTDSAWLAAKYGLPYAFAGHFAPAQMQKAFTIYKENYQPSDKFPKPYTIAAINVIAADSNEKAHLIATSLFQAFRNILNNDRKPLQPPVKDFEKQLSPPEISGLNQMLSLTFIGDKNSLFSRLQEFLKEYNADEIIAVSHIYDHQERLKSYRILKEVIDKINTI